MVDVHGPWMLVPFGLRGHEVQRIRFSVSVDHTPAIEEWLRATSEIVAAEMNGEIDPNQAETGDV